MPAHLSHAAYRKLTGQKAPRVKRVKSALEETLAAQIKTAGLPEPYTEYIFACQDGAALSTDFAGRKWRVDFFWFTFGLPLAVEVEGGTFSRGRHVRGVGYEEDVRKYNAMARLGYRVLRFTGRMVKSGEALRLIKEALQ